MTPSQSSLLPSASGRRTATLRVAAGPHRGRTRWRLDSAYTGVGLERREPVTIVSLADSLRTPDVRRPDVIKIDAAGAELHVLHGGESMLRDVVPVIVDSTG